MDKHERDRAQAALDEFMEVLDGFVPYAIVETARGVADAIDGGKFGIMHEAVVRAEKQLEKAYTAAFEIARLAALAGIHYK